MLNLSAAKEGKLIHVKDEELDSAEETDVYHNGVLCQPILYLFFTRDIGCREKMREIPDEMAELSARGKSSSHWTNGRANSKMEEQATGWKSRHGLWPH